MLKGISLVLSSISACALSIAMGMDMWLMMSEPFLTEAVETEPNNTVLLKTTLHSSSGFWRLCVAHDIQEFGSQTSRLPQNCASQDVWSQPWTAHLQNTPTIHAILKGMRPSGVPMAMSYFLLLAGFCATVCSTIRLPRLLLIGAVFFITSTLVMSVGVIMLMEVIHEEVGSRCIPYIENVNHTEMAFSYKYDLSFILVALTFLAQSMAAVCNIYVYESHFKQSPAMLAMMVTGLHSVIKQDENTHEQTNRNNHQMGTLSSQTSQSQPAVTIGQMGLV